MKQDQIDVAIIGAGPAGLHAAYGLRNSGLSVRVFEALDHVGGRTRSAIIDGQIVNTGAMFVYIGSRSETICEEMGLQLVPVSPPSFGISYAGRTIIARSDAELLQKLSLPEQARQQFAKVLSEVRKEYETYMGNKGLTEESKQLAHLSISDHLGTLDPIVESIVDNAVRGGSSADPKNLSAQYALRYFASYLVRATGHRSYLPGGMQSMSTALAQRLGSNILELNTKVLLVSEIDGSYSLSISKEGKNGLMEATKVVWAIPGPGVAELAPWLPEWKLGAIEKIPTYPTVTLAIVLDSTDIQEWDDIFCVVAVDAVFNMVLQPRVAADVIPSKNNRTCFYCYLSADAKAAKPGNDSDTIAQWLEDFYRVIPNSRGRMIDTVLTRWKRCFASPGPGREHLLADVRRPVGNMHFAGDYTSDTAGSHGAFTQGERVAREILGHN